MFRDQHHSCFHSIFSIFWMPSYADHEWKLAKSRETHLVQHDVSGQFLQVLQVGVEEVCVG